MKLPYKTNTYITVHGVSEIYKPSHTYSNTESIILTLSELSRTVFLCCIPSDMLASDMLASSSDNLELYLVVSCNQSKNNKVETTAG